MVRSGVHDCRARQRFIIELAAIFARINSTIEKCAPEMGDFMNTLRKLIFRDPVCKMFASNNPSFFTCLTVLCNRQTGEHRDMFNHLRSMEALFMAGDYTGGELELPELGVTFKYGPGSFLFFRGRAFSHRVKDWKPAREGQPDEGKRLCFSLYTQQAVVRALQVPSSDPALDRSTLPDVPSQSFDTSKLPFFLDPVSGNIVPAKSSR